MKSIERKPVFVKVLKFEIEYEVDLNAILRSIGVDISFDKKSAIFNAMSIESYRRSDRRLYSSEVIHKAVVETTEVGKQADAPPERYPNQPEFIVDHPFAFMIMYRKKKLRIFVFVVIPN